MKTIKVILVLILVAGVAKLAYFYSGHYDIGADAPHWPITVKVIDLVRERSIEVRADEIQVPNLDDAAMIADGAAHYGEMCVACHLAPGIDDTELRQGLYPQPPKLAEPWPSDPREQFWAIKHGIKLTGMPAWGKTHDDAAIWAIVAFLKKLPSLSPEQYRAMTAQSGHSHGVEAEPQHASQPAAAGSPEAAVDAFTSALAAGNAKAAEAWLAPDLLVYESGNAESSRDEYVGHHLKADMEFLASAKTERLERASNGGAETAWVTTRVRIGGPAAGKPVDLYGTETMVLTRDEKDGWRIRHIHWSSASATQ